VEDARREAPTTTDGGGAVVRADLVPAVVKDDLAIGIN
jgi:hypothetical protein